MALSDLSRGLSTITGAAASIGSAQVQAMGVLNNINGTASRISSAIGNVSSAADAISNLRSFNLPAGGNPVASFAAGAALFTNALGAVGGIAGALGGLASALSGGGGGSDWRATLTGAVVGKLVFPYTPTISISGGASYDEQPITHQNYSFFAYQNSKAETIQIQAPFFVSDSVEGQTWISALSFLRACTKMFSDGNPPIILKFNAYGDHVFKDIPVVVKSYSCDLPADVDYIACGSSHVPIKSSFSVQLQPIYSREKVKTFNLQSFISGGAAGFV